MRGPLKVMSTFATIADGDNVSYVLSHELRIVQTNAAWERFARANGGDAMLASWQPGTSLLQVVPGPLQPFYRAGFASAADSRDRWEHDYECSSPTTFRKFRMLVYPFSGSFLVTHALLVERPVERTDGEPATSYERDGVIAMCSHCRRVRHPSKPERWDWVPELIAAMPPNLSHGLCPACYRYYYE